MAYLSQVAAAFTHRGFPAYFRVELSWAKLLGLVLLPAPVAARLEEWAYAGFAFALGSALIAHVAVGDGPEAWGWAAGTGGALGALVLLLAPPPGHAGERLDSLLSSASCGSIFSSSSAATTAFCLASAWWHWRCLARVLAAMLGRIAMWI